jgi:hypothetical protein
MNENVILYSTGCPKCQVLVKKLAAAGVEYSVITDVDEMLALGIKAAPMLEVDGRMMDFSGAIAWVRDLPVGKE